MSKSIATDTDEYSNVARVSSKSNDEEVRVNRENARIRGNFLGADGGAIVMAKDRIVSSEFCEKPLSGSPYPKR